jgi:hypothetical protein
MKKLIKLFWLPAAGGLAGAAAGFFYWKYIGCISGTCAITSSPVNSTIYFSILGVLLFSVFQRNGNKQ